MSDWTSTVLAMSFEGMLAPTFELRLRRRDTPRPDGWGVGWYARGEPSATIMKRTTARARVEADLSTNDDDDSKPIDSTSPERDSSIFVAQVRHATWGRDDSLANTQPFLRSWRGRDWMFCHGGSLRELPVVTGMRFFDPVGSTDSELLFCELMHRIVEHGWKNLDHVDFTEVQRWLNDWDALGGMTCILTDGRDVLVHADDECPLHVWEVLPPHGSLNFGNDEFEVDLTRRGIKSLKGLIACSTPLETPPGCQARHEVLPPGSLLVLREGTVRVRLEQRRPPTATLTAAVNTNKPAASTTAPLAVDSRGVPIVDASPAGPTNTDTNADAAGADTKEGSSGDVAPPTPAVAAPTRNAERSIAVVRLPARPRRSEPRTYEVVHETVYRYDSPVEHSAHMLRVTPYHDRMQQVLDHEIHVTVDARMREYDDVFGNRVHKLLVESPYTEFRVESRAFVRLLDTDPFAFRPLHARDTIPLVWMPWQHHMLTPYLLPPELPETQLLELVDYAMSFVRRNDYDIFETLLDINETIFREYGYIPGSTNVYTTAFEVYERRRGVCQDFANLFICLARLLGVPARYTCGYIYTGPKNPNHVQSEASHAWVQVYLPEVGWKGFDPTNGILCQTEHVRTAVGRNYIDATPTSGTIYVGGSGEKLAVAVRMEPVEDDEIPALLEQRRAAGHGMRQLAGAVPTRVLVGLQQAMQRKS